MEHSGNRVWARLGYWELAGKVTESSTSKSGSGCCASAGVVLIDARKCSETVSRCFKMGRLSCRERWANWIIKRLDSYIKRSSLRIFGTENTSLRPEQRWTGNAAITGWPGRLRNALNDHRVQRAISIGCWRCNFECLLKQGVCCLGLAFHLSEAKQDFC